MAVMHFFKNGCNTDPIRRRRRCVGMAVWLGWSPILSWQRLQLITYCCGVP